ncbi:PIN domain-containing protein [Herbaspirillum chlorophenolicum]|uniref:PIN domain-containing protein n=1 Tax=Herbaspirillum chlorophenolicum TaxID=211589 RepID=UPI00067DE23F|nr:PIN domain-containing protein [Herbaspirillum chlorophenolicum]
MDSSSKKYLTIFIDTNITLHYQRLDQVSWEEFAQGRNVEIVVCAVVLMEIEKNKVENQSKKIRKRAGEYGAWLLNKYDSPELTQNVKIRFHANEPMIDFHSNGLDKQNFDDRLVAAVLEHRENNPSKDVLVLTADLGVTFKFKMRGIEVTNLSEKYKLPEELDEQETENRELRSQLEKFKNRHPKVRLLFDQNEPFIEVEKEAIPQRDQFLTREMTRMMEKHPKKKNHPGYEIGSNLASHAVMLQLGKIFNEMSESQQASYDQRLDEFYIEYHTYLENIYDFHLRSLARVELNLLMSNLDGSAPANNIDVFVRCSKPFSFLKEDLLPNRPKAPTPPRKPNSLFDSGINHFSTHLPHIPSMKDILLETASETPKLEIVGGDAKFYVRQLKHKQSFKLFPIWLDLQSVQNMNNLAVTYEIHAEEILSPVTGSLHVRFT